MTMSVDRPMSTFKERALRWKAKAKANERHWLMAEDLKWAIGTTTTEAELAGAVQKVLSRYGWQR